MKVEVVISTFNGEKYIEEQILSIFEQKNVEIHITVRDDGSKDNTVSILNLLAQKNPNKIKVICGENIGYRKSFMIGLKKSEEADYYAFSDQDDVWLPNKLDIAVKKISSLDSNMKLYTSSLIITDEKLKRIGFNDISNMTNDVACYFSRPRLAGCTFVFNKKLKSKAICLFDLCNMKQISENSFPDHDFILGSIAFSCGKVFIDKDSYILHRRLLNSATSGGNGLKKRIKTEYKYFFHRNKYRTLIADFLLEDFKDDLKKEIICFLQMLVKSNDSLKMKLKLIRFKKFSSNIFICDIETKLCVLLGLL